MRDRPFTRTGTRFDCRAGYTRIGCDVRSQLGEISAIHRTIRAEIERRFPSYGGLIAPKAPTVEQARRALQPREALVAVYTGEHQTFIWVLPAGGPMVFSATDLPRTASPPASTRCGRLSIQESRSWAIYRRSMLRPPMNFMRRC